MERDPKDYGIELPFLVKEETGRTVYPDPEDVPPRAEGPETDKPDRERAAARRKAETHSRKKASTGKEERSRERKQAEEDWNAYLKGEPLKEQPERPVRKKGLHAGGIVLLILGILIALVAVVSTYAFVALYLPLVRNGVTTFSRMFRSMLIFIGIPWFAAAVLLVFAFAAGKKK